MRYRWLDYLRGIAALWMIEVHVVDVVLDRQWQQAWWFPWLSITHGFVAVVFLFCAGGAFALTLEQKLDAYRRGERPLWNYLAKLGLLLLLGYWLHLPGFSLERTLQATAQEWRQLADCDILQTIAYTSLLALILALLFPRPTVHRSVYVLLTATFALLTPWVWEHQLYTQLPVFIGALIAPQPVSKFPLFPFAAYFFAGTIAIPLFRERTAQQMAGIVAIATAGAFVTLTIGMSSPTEWWHISPLHVLFRLSGTVALLGVLYLADAWIARRRFSTLLLLAGQQSLWIYVVHLLLVYGSVGGKGLSAVVGRTLSPATTFLLIIGIGVATMASAWGWAELKRTMPAVVRTVTITAVAIGVLTFLILPARLAELLTTGEEVQLDVSAPVVYNDPPR